MTVFLTYNLKVAVCIAVFFLVYKVLLSRDTFHGLNRAVLISMVALSFTLPLGLITVQRQAPQTEIPALPLLEQREDGTAPVSVLPNALPATTVAAAPAPVATAASEKPAGRWILPAVWWAGTAASLLVWLLSLARVTAAVRKGERIRIGRRFTLVKKDDDTVPFSWIRYIVISRRDYEEYGDEIVAHEMAHLRLRHSWDLILLDLAGCLQWFNPAMWLLRREMRNVHEYEADREVLRAGFDAREYQMMLIKKAAGTGRYSIADSLDHSNLKKRITMMLQKESGLRARLKVLAILPLAAIGLTAFANREFRSPNGKDSVKIMEASDWSLEWQYGGDFYSKSVYVYHPIPEQMPQYLSVDLHLDTLVGGRNNIYASFVVTPAASIDRNISPQRFFIDLTGLGKDDELIFEDITDAIAGDGAAAVLSEGMVEELKRFPLQLGIQRNGGNFVIYTRSKGYNTTNPRHEEANVIRGGESRIPVMNIYLGRDGTVTAEGETVSLSQLPERLAAIAAQTGSVPGRYEARITVDDKAKWGMLFDLREALLDNGILSFVNSPALRGGVNQGMEYHLKYEDTSKHSIADMAIGHNADPVRKEEFVNRSLLEIGIDPANRITLNSETVDLNDLENSIKAAAQQRGKSVREMMILISSDMDADYGVVEDVEIIGKRMLPAWFGYVYYNLGERYQDRFPY